MNQSIPEDIGVYLYASNIEGCRRTGISSHFDLARNERNIISEFSFWPIGTVMSFGRLSHSELAPIHHWVRYSYDYKGTVDLHLSVNPIHSAYPLDFRTESQMSSSCADNSAALGIPSEEDARELVKDTLSRSGGDGKGFIFSTHPEIFRRIRESQGQP